MALRGGGGGIEKCCLTNDGEGAERGVFEVCGRGGDAGTLDLVAKASEVHAEACECYKGPNVTAASPE